MVARTPTGIKGDEIEVGYWHIYDVQVSKDDTVTLSEFSSSVVLNEVWIVKKSTRTEVTCTHADKNIVTVTGTASDDDCYLVAFGVKA